MEKEGIPGGTHLCPVLLLSRHGGGIYTQPQIAGSNPEVQDRNKSLLCHERKVVSVDLGENVRILNEKSTAYTCIPIMLNVNCCPGQAAQRLEQPSSA